MLKNGTQFEYRTNKSHKDYLYGFYEDMDMVQWTGVGVSAQIAFIAQCYFLGFTAGILLISMPENLGRTKTFKYLVVPASIAANLLATFSANYWARCGAFFVMGIIHVKFVCNLVNMQEQAEIADTETAKRYNVIATSLVQMLDSSSQLTFALYMIFVSRDAFHFFHSYNVICIVAVMALIFVLLVESPLWLIRNDMQKEGLASLRHIARINGSAKNIEEAL